MPPKKEPTTPSSATRRRPADTPTAREQQMINYADELAEKQLREGTASAQVITHFLKLGTSREQLEQEKIRAENLRLEAQIAQIKSQARTEDLMERVLAAMKVYSGQDDDDDL
jgi:hypothetical protein